MRKVKLVKFSKFVIIELECTHVSIIITHYFLTLGQAVVILLIFKNIHEILSQESCFDDDVPTLLFVKLNFH